MTFALGLLLPALLLGLVLGISIGRRIEQVMVNRRLIRNQQRFFADLAAAHDVPRFRTADELAVEALLKSL